VVKELALLWMQQFNKKALFTILAPGTLNTDKING